MSFRRDKPMSKTPLQRRAIEVVRREMHLYDHLSATPRLRVDAPTRRDEDITVGPDIQTTRRCAHDVALHDTCSLCGRDSDDVKAYRVAAQQRIKDLLKQLGE
jgi:hypothetical protein